MAETVRERVLEAMKDALAEIEGGLPATDPYWYTPSKVVRGPLTDADARKRLMIGVVDGEEMTRDLFPLVEISLRVAVEFRFTHNKDDAGPSTEANRVLGDIKRKLGEDRTLGGLALDLQEVGSDIILESDEDRGIEGALFVVVKFRHALNDPRSAQ